MTKQELEQLLKYHDDLYYNQDDPEISDAEYDVLKNQYVQAYGEYNYVPGEASEDSVKFTHTTNVSSLDKIQVTDISGLRANLERLWPVVIQPKMDGLTLVSYPDGKHVTRGNGTVGEVVTDKVNAGVEGIGVVHKSPVRSEVVMLKSFFEPINKKRVQEGKEPFKNLRNAAAGMLRNKDVTKVEGLMAYAYNLIRTEENNNVSGQMHILEESEWNTVFSYIPVDIDQAMNFITTFDEEFRDKLDYEIDGLVIKHNGDKVFGETRHHPKNAIAVKFEAEGEWTVIERVVWTVGRTGKITPVAEFKPVEILGATINRATLHNYGIMKALDLITLESEGKHEPPCTRVKVIKANDVIPAIVEVEHPNIERSNIYSKFIFEPEKCPECGGTVHKINDQLFCKNSHCPAKIEGNLIHMAKRDALDIEGLSEETAKKLVNKYKTDLEAELNETLRQLEKGELILSESEAMYYSDEYENIQYLLKNMHPSFIYNLDVEDFLKLEGFAQKSATNLYEAIQKTRTAELDKVIYAAGMPLIGRSVSKLIAETYGNPLEMAKDSKEFSKLKDVPGIGTEIINSLKENYTSMLVPFGDYITIKEIKKTEKAANQLNFVITGKFELSRDQIKTMIVEKGHKVSGSVSSKTSYLLASPGEESTTKYQKAVSLGTNIIHSIDELLTLI